MTDPELREKSRDFWHFCSDFIKRESGQEFRESGQEFRESGQEFRESGIPKAPGRDKNKYFF